MDELSPALQTVQEALAQQYGEAVACQPPFRGELTVLVPVDRLLEILAWLKTAEGFGFTMLTDVTALDHLPREPRFEVVYHLFALETGSRLRLKIQVGESEPVPSITSLWSGANYSEREVFDLFGIPFRGHPNLQRLVTPDGFEGHPLRKDFDLGDIPVDFDIPHRKRFSDATN